MRITTFALCLVLAVAAVLSWRWLHPDDETQIRQALDRMAAAMSVGPEDGDLARLARLQRLGEDMAEDVNVDAGAPFGAMAGRAEVVAAAGRIVASLRRLELGFVDVSVDVDPGRTTARATLTAEAQFEDRAGPGFDARELDLTFSQIDGRWLLQSAVAVRVLQPLVEHRRGAPSSSTFVARPRGAPS